jgi:hypothetical protein
MMTNRIRAKPPSKNKSLIFYATVLMVIIGLARFLIYINESADEIWPVTTQLRKDLRPDGIDTASIDFMNKTEVVVPIMKNTKPINSKPPPTKPTQISASLGSFGNKTETKPEKTKPE